MSAEITTWNFRKCRLRGYPAMKAEWFLVITSLSELDRFINLTSRSKAEQAFSEAKKLVLSSDGGPRIRGHFTNTLGAAAQMVSEIRGTSWVVGLANILAHTESAMRGILFRGHTLLIRQIGSFTCDDPEPRLYDVLEETKSDKLIWPGFKSEDIRLIQWPNGTHWYAKIGNLDVVWNREQK